MKTLRMVLVGIIVLATGAIAADLRAANDRDHDRDNRLSATLIGFHEVPVVSTVASGRFKAQISRDQKSIDYELSFKDLQGPVQQAHIHVAQKNVNGAIVLWLCQGATAAPASVAMLTPSCPQEGTVTGTLTAANVVQPTPAPQQIFAGDFDKVLEAIRAGKAYANVHTTPSPGGEIRGQIHVGDDHDNHGHGRD
jgi:hypothetical protein